ncbi:hypothetical protein ACFL5J_00035 [Thermodesulfobacteriota bacterium]
MLNPATNKLDKINHWFVLFFILFIVGMSYANTLYSPLVLDDAHSFIEEQYIYIEDFSLQSLQQLSEGRFGYSRIIPIFTFAVNNKLYKKNKSFAQYHITNIFIHILTTISIFFFINALLKSPLSQRKSNYIRTEHIALIVCALWALNPVQTNAVTYLVQRMTSLAALFYITSLSCYLHGRIHRNNTQRYLFFSLSLVFALFSFLSKENSYTLPLVILLIEIMFFSPHLPRKILQKTKWYHLTIIAICALLTLPLLERPFHETIVNGYSQRRFSPYQRILTEGRVVVHYLSLLSFPLPSRLCLEYDFPLSTSLTTPPTTILSFLFLFSLLLTALKLRKKHKIISFGIFWFFINLMIESTIIPLEIIFEHRVYLPSVGFFLSTVIAIESLITREDRTKDTNNKKLLIAMSVIIAALYSTLTTIRNHTWRDNYSIQLDSVTKYPNKARTLLNYGISLGSAGKKDEAKEIFEKTMALSKKNAGLDAYDAYLQAANNLVVHLIKEKKYLEGIEKSKQMLKRMPASISSTTMPYFLYNLGLCYHNSKQYKFAYESYINALQLPSDITKSHLEKALLNLFFTVNSDDSLREHMGLTNNVNPKTNSLLRLSEILINFRDYDGAQKYLNKAKLISENDYEYVFLNNKLQNILNKNQQSYFLINIKNNPHYQSNLTYKLLSNGVRIIETNYRPLHPALGWILQKTHKAYPGDPFVALSLCRWYIDNNNYKDAKRLIENNLNNSPESPLFLDEMARISILQNQLPEALKAYRKLLEIYPGHPQWRWIELQIKTIERNLQK